uniref:Uncharacterized protein n=1 Tax=Phlebotomus papatasi TaxID=29031 RepID=A0A1B0DK88_PHLPP
MASSVREVEGTDEVSMREELMEDVEMREVNADESHFMATNMFSNQKRPTMMFYQPDGFWRVPII